MALENIVKGAENYANLAQLAGTYEDKVVNPEKEKLALITNYIASGGETPDQGLVNNYLQNPGLLSERMNEDIKEQTEQLSKDVKSNYNAIMKDVSEDALSGLAFEYFSDEGKKAQEVLSAVKQGNLNKLREAYSKTFKTDKWKKWIKEKAPESFIKNSVSSYLQRVNMKFSGQFMSKKKDKEGKEEQYLDKNKVLKYISKKINALDEDKKKEAYVNIGVFYHSMKQAANASNN